MTSIPRLVGMIHLLPLPGSPRFGGSMGAVIDAARSDAATLADAGFPAVMVENFGDVPFHADSVPAETIAAMSIAVGAVAHESGLVTGVNVLRNDALAAAAIAAATGVAFIRVNVLTGMMYTDQGPIVGKADSLHRLIAGLGIDLEVWADVMVKHAVAPPGQEPGRTAIDMIERGLADALIVTGSGTGKELDLAEAREIRTAVPAGTRIVAGSGVRSDNLSALTKVIDAVIVGSSLKPDADPGKRVDAGQATEFVRAAKEAGLT